jgi:MerR family transcriptional regulator, thiopeptide resistance regulator
VAANDNGWRVGELARATGLTVRTLHYYDEIGLVSPSYRSDGGHRVYRDADVERLYRVCMLRRLGLPLAQITDALKAAPGTATAILTAHLDELDRRLETEQRLRSRLASLLSHTSGEMADRGHDLLEVLEDMTAVDTGVQRRISILVYADLEAAYTYLTRVFGLGEGELTRDGTGRVVHAELQAGDGVLWLHNETEEWALASPQRVGSATGMVAVLVDDVDAHYRHAVEQGANIRYAPVDQPYGYREYGALDCEGHLWSFMKPLDS